MALATTSDSRPVLATVFGTGRYRTLLMPLLLLHFPPGPPGLPPPSAPRPVLPTVFGTGRYRTLLMPLLLLHFRPGPPGLLTVILPSLCNKMVAIRQQRRNDSRILSIGLRACPQN